MSRQQRTVPRTQAEPRPSQPPQPAVRGSRFGRESIESFVVVFLGFLVWSIDAEGFVIPTGSMATTLMGRHKEVTCPQCGYVYSVNADREVESSGPVTGKLPRVRGGTCVNCRFESALDDTPSLSGDRIYVLKSGLSLPFASASRQVRLNRWDVGVFKLPENPEIRYIKRTVGMPGEVVRIQGGDLWSRPVDDPSVPFQQLHRPVETQRAMGMMVYDDAHRPKALVDDPRWRRWVSAANGSEGWSEPTVGTFVSSSGANDWSELRYRHIVPEPEQWPAILEGGELPRQPRRSLITDFYSYNTDITAVDGRNPSRPWFQPNWVGDLTVSMRVKTPTTSGRLRIELIKAGVAGACEIDLASGEATLRQGSETLGASAATGIRPGGEHVIVLANVDNRLTLWVDKDLPFGEGRTYDPKAEALSPTAEDLEPVRIATQGAAVEVGGLILERDIHYTLNPAEADESFLNDIRGLGPAAYFDLISDPSRFPELARRGFREYPLDPGCYLMLGDNSPWSRDARAWGRVDQIHPDDPDQGWDASGRDSWEVPANLVVGKAFCVYWPSVSPVWPWIRLGPDLRVPFRPSLEKMRWIR